MNEKEIAFVNRVFQDVELVKDQIKEWYDQNTDWRQMEIGFMLTDVLGAFYGMRGLVKKLEKYTPV